jgi:hypothetical protein
VILLAHATLGFLPSPLRLAAHIHKLTHARPAQLPALARLCSLAITTAHASPATTAALVPATLRLPDLELFLAALATAPHRLPPTAYRAIGRAVHTRGFAALKSACVIPPPPPLQHARRCANPPQARPRCGLAD